MGQFVVRFPNCIRETHLRAYPNWEGEGSPAKCNLSFYFYEYYPPRVAIR
jgi:hypothetical protein